MNALSAKRQPQEEEILDLAAFYSDMQAARHARDTIHFMCYDIDALRNINYAYGREVGDALLLAIANWILRSRWGTLYRIDGDLFCLVVRSHSTQQVLEFAESAFQRSKSPWMVGVDGRLVSICVTASICVVRADREVWKQELPDLFERTLSFSRNEKAVVLFSHEKDCQARQGIRLQMELKNSVMQNMKGFSLHYQPIVDPKTGLWRGLEVLSRWDSDQFGRVSPIVFIKEIEQMGLIDSQGQWVLETAIAKCTQLGLAQLEGFFLSVNITSRQIAQKGFAEQLEDIIRKYDYPYHKLNLEITESAEFEFTPQSRQTVDFLRRRGISLALDDFGTGYSTLNNMTKIPASYIKTEREFIVNIEEDQFMNYYLYTIVETAHLNGMSIIAEGVESLGQLQQVINCGADLVQGYYYSKPLPADALEQSVDRFTCSPKAPEPKLLRPVAQSFEKWIVNQGPLLVTPALFGLLASCIRVVLNEKNLDNMFGTVFSLVGKHFKASRVFALFREEDGLYSSRYEWCAAGVPSTLEHMQGMDFAAAGIQESLLNQQFMMRSCSENLSEPVRQMLRERGLDASIPSMFLHPLTSGGHLIGCVGMAGEADREWSAEEVLVMHNLSFLVLISMSIRKGDSPDFQHSDSKEDG